MSEDSSAYVSTKVSVSRKWEANDLVKYFPVFGAFLIYLGVQYLNGYYRSFNITILRFMDFGEILTAFLDVLSTVMTTVFYTYICTTSYYSITGEEITKKQIKLLSGFMMLSIIATTSFAYLAITRYEYSYQQASITSLVIFMLLLNVLMYKKYGRLPFSTIFGDLMIIIGLFALVSLYDSHAVKHNKKTIGTVIKFKNYAKPFISDSFNYYIGKTDNYVFIYQQKKDITDVYKVDNIEYMLFKGVTNISPK